MTSRLWLMIAVCSFLTMTSALAGTEAGPWPLSRIVASVQLAEATELARLEEAIAASTDRTEILDLQRCAAYVKLAGRLALCEGRLGVTGDETEKVRLADSARSLRTELDLQALALPGGYEYDPLARLKQEVQPCVE